MLTKIEKFSIYLYKHKTGYGKNDPQASDRRTRRVAAPRRAGAEQPSLAGILGGNERNRAGGGVARRLRKGRSILKPEKPVNILSLRHMCSGK